MNNFINNIFDFIKSIITSIESYFLNDNNFINFWNSNIVNGDLFTIDLSYRELFYYLTCIILVFLIIYLFVKYILKLLTLFKF